MAILLGLQIPRLWSIGLPDLFPNSIREGFLGIDVWMLAIGIISDIGLVSESLLILYLIVRLLRGKAVLTKWTFLLVFPVFLSWFSLYFFPVLSNLQFWSPNFTLPSIVNYLVLAAAAAVFSFRTFMALRNGREFELVLPLFLRISVIFYALVEGAYGAWNSYVSANLAFSFNPVEALFIVLNVSFYIGLIAVCIFPPRFVVGETNTGEHTA